MRLLSNLHVKGKPAALPDHAICRQSHYFIYRPRSSYRLAYNSDTEGELKEAVPLIAGRFCFVKVLEIKLNIFLQLCAPYISLSYVKG